ncbi:hypothetical protein NONI108955_27380 [Nocardia ninae]
MGQAEFGGAAGGDLDLFDGDVDADDLLGLEFLGPEEVLVAVAEADVELDVARTEFGLAGDQARQVPARLVEGGRVVAPVAEIDE